MGWTPRAACTLSMEIWTLYLGIYAEASSYIPSQSSSCQGPCIHAYRMFVLGSRTDGGAATNSDLLNSSFFRFKIVMNPYARAVAIYHDAMEFPSFYGITHRDYSFNEFLGYIANGGNFGQLGLFHIESRAHADGRGHWDAICQIEHIKPCLSYINQKQGTNFTLPPASSYAATEHHAVHQHMTGDVANTKWSRLRQKSGTRLLLPTWEDYYAQGGETAGLVKQLGAHDFDELNEFPYTTDSQ